MKYSTCLSEKAPYILDKSDLSFILLLKTGEMADQDILHTAEIVKAAIPFVDSIPCDPLLQGYLFKIL